LTTHRGPDQPRWNRGKRKEAIVAR
jgi:hypothetical protein